MTAETTELMKTCCRCGFLKPATRSYFHKNVRGKLGLDPRCRECKRAENPGKRVRTTDIRPREERIVDTHKECLACHETKPMEEFGRCKKGFAGRLSYCTICANRRANLYQKKYREDSWENRLLLNARVAVYGGGASKGRKERIASWAPLDIDADYLRELLQDQDGKCGWTGIALSLREIVKPWSISLDRLDCDQGYIKGNVMLTCRAVNLARNNSSPEDFLAFIQMIKEV